MTAPNIEVYPTSLGDYEGALVVAREENVSVNDALAYQLMRGHGQGETTAQLGLGARVFDDRRFRFLLI